MYVTGMLLGKYLLNDWMHREEAGGETPRLREGSEVLLGILALFMTSCVSLDVQ